MTERGSTFARALPAALLAVAAASALWTVPALMRTAGTVRAARSMDAAAGRLDGPGVLEAMGAAMRDVGAGSIIYVAAHQPHRFTDIEEELQVVVFFAAPR